MKLFRFSLFFLFLIADLVSVVEGGTLGGMVLQVGTDAPLRGASVVVDGLDLGAEADAEGRFELGTMPAGVYTVRASHVGFRDAVREGVRVSATGRTEVRLVLEPEVIQLDELEVVAQPVGAADIHRMPSFVTVVKQEAFEGRVTSVPEVLSASTGVQVKRLGGLGSFSTISIRGSSAEQVEVYLDGILLNSALGGGVNLSNLPLANVAQVEVYRGAASEGSGMGGTVHIRTRSAGKGRRYGGSGSWGSFDTRGLNVLLSGRRADTDYLLMADYSASDSNFRFLDDNGTEYNAQDDAPASRRNNNFVSGSMLGKWGRRFAGGRQVTVHENLYWKRQGIPGISNNQSQHVRFNTFRNLTEIGLSIPNWLERFSVRQTAFFSHQLESFIDREGEVGIGRQDNRYLTRSYGMNSLLQMGLTGQSAMAVHASVRRETYRPEALLEKQVRQLASSRLAAVGRVGVDWALPKHAGVFSASANVEYQRSHIMDESPFGFSPLSPDTTTGRALVGLRAGLRLDLGPGICLKANVGRSRRAPSFFELFGDRGGVIGNTELEPELGLTWDAGVRLQSEAGAALEGVYFDHRYDDLIQFVQTSQAVSRPYNIGRARVRGVETMLNLIAFGRWTISANYTFQRARDASRIPHRRGKVLPNRPVHEMHAHTGFDLGRWAVFYDYTFEDGNFLDQANLRPIPARYIHNAGVRCALYRQVQVTVEAKNLRDTQVADTWGYPLPGRSYFATVKEEF